MWHLCCLRGLCMYVPSCDGNRFWCVTACPAAVAGRRGSHGLRCWSFLQVAAVVTFCRLSASACCVTVLHVMGGSGVHDDVPRPPRTSHLHSLHSFTTVYLVTHLTAVMMEGPSAALAGVPAVGWLGPPVLMTRNALEAGSGLVLIYTYVCYQRMLGPLHGSGAQPNSLKRTPAVKGSTN